MPPGDDDNGPPAGKAGAGDDPAASARPADAAAADPEPGASGKIATAAALGEDTRRRITGAAKDALDAGVSKLGSGIETLGEGVSRLGELSHIPVVGTGVVKLGEGITSVGEQLHELPRVARTRRGRLLIRSVIVGFVLVAAWIGVIVGLQLHGNDTPDFRPDAERILVALSRGAIDEVYEQASPRFQEIMRKEPFIDEMNDLTHTVGKFREITSVNDTLVTTGPTGRIGRVSLTVAYAKAICPVSVSLHNDQGRWKLLGIGVELPLELKISQAQREERVRACKEPMDVKHCDVHQAADAILRKLDGGRAGEVWDEATQVFQQQEPKAKFIQLQLEHLAALGGYRRIIAATEAKLMIGGTSATFDALAEFEKASGVRTVFAFYHRSRADPWRLRSFKVVLPMPRAADDGARAEPLSGSAAPGRPSPSTPAAPPANASGPSHLAPRDAGPR